MPTPEELEKLARDNVDAHLADSIAEYSEDPEEGPPSAVIFEHAFVLAFDAMHDAGCPSGQARELARVVALEYSGGPATEEEM